MAVFISYSSKDQHSAEAICNAIENRGFPCWISSRDIGPGQNFQSSIVQAIRGAKVMILVFSGNANNSEEIKKELVLAGQSRLVVIPVRVEDVAPGDAFAYEFATRQWIDVFQNWEHAIERVTQQIQAVIATEPAAAPASPLVTETVAVPPLRPAVAPPPQRGGNSTAIWAGAAVAAVVALGVIGWLVFGAQHSAPPSAAPAPAPSAAAPVPPASSPASSASSATAAPAPSSSPVTPSPASSAASAVSPTPTSAPTAAAAQVSPAATPPAPSPASPPASSSSGSLSPFNAINQGVDAIKKQP